MFRVISEVSPSDRARRAAASRIKQGRNASGQKSQGHPTTSDRVYDKDEVEFLCAIEHFKCRSGRRFPTWTEALRVLKSLGYTKSADANRECA